jgi:hypothetical protein
VSPSPITTNTLFYGDNLPILREYLADGSIDLEKYNYEDHTWGMPG